MKPAIIRLVGNLGNNPLDQTVTWGGERATWEGCPIPSKSIGNADPRLPQSKSKKFGTVSTEKDDWPPVSSVRKTSASSVEQAMALTRQNRVQTGESFGLTEQQMSLLQQSREATLNSKVVIVTGSRWFLLGVSLKQFFGNVKEILFHAYV